MKVVVALVTGLALAGCTSPSPVAPSPVNSTTFLWAMVVDGTGVCIPGASIEVVIGQGAGQTFAQATPCTAWTDDGGVVFSNLTPGRAMTLRALAPGYVPQEKSVVTSSGPQQSLLLTPSRQ